MPHNLILYYTYYITHAYTQLLERLKHQRPKSLNNTHGINTTRKLTQQMKKN